MKLSEFLKENNSYEKFIDYALEKKVKTLDDLKLLLNGFDIDEDKFREIPKEINIYHYDVCSNIDEKIWVPLREKLREYED